MGLGALLEGLEKLLHQRLLQQEFPVELCELRPDAALELGEGLRLRVAKTPHTAESLAVRIDGPDASLAYTGDTAPSAQLAEFFQIPPPGS